ncbi:hypothetical protein Q5O14_01280 [Eubacteriaceae bacterium ES2]|nr:hypothetical protein Q5O14_01280 [Eubacteriaceae bacterium ES2]
MLTIGYRADWPMKLPSDCRLMPLSMVEKTTTITAVILYITAVIVT